MDLRGNQDKRFGMPNSLGTYNPPIRETSSTSIIPPPTTTPLGERSRREGNGNGITMFTSSQTLDHHNHHHHHHHHHDHEERDPDPEPDPDPDPDPDPIPVSIAVTGSSSSTSVVRYQECLKNHAASVGGHVIDGCCEFMPDGEDGTPESLKCAACDCHRNFHRKEINGENQSGANRLYYYRSNKIPPPHLPLPPPPPPHPSTSIPPPMMMAFGGGGGVGVGALGPTDSSSDELNVYHSNVGATVAMAPPQPQTFASSKKRFRTKFTQEQKDKMLDLAEKIGWRIQKQDESTVQQFCEEVGVKRQVLKVWMHNNKHSSMKKKD